MLETYLNNESPRIDEVSLDNDQYLMLVDKLQSTNEDLLKVKRANLNMKREIKQLRRLVKRLKDEAAKDRKPNYKNKKRGNKHGSVNR